MKIIFAKIDTILQLYSIEFLEKFAQKNFKSQKKLLEHSIGRFLVDLALKELFNIQQYSICLNNKKPKLNINLDFSISHTDNIVFAGFSNQGIGLDAEIIKDRNFKKILHHYNIDQIVDKTTFYQLWTNYEASIKNNCTNISSYKYKNYILSIASLDENIEIYEACNVNSKIKLISRFNNKKPIFENLFEELKPLNFKLKNRD